MDSQILTYIMLPLFLFSSFLFVTSASTIENFHQCLSKNGDSDIINNIYSINTSSYLSLLDFTIQNLRFSTSTTPKPQFIITPHRASHIQKAVVCSKKHGFHIRVRSGGHDYNGLSYVSKISFVLIDLINYQDVKVDVKQKTAWVQAGANIGKVLYKISQQSNTLAFASSICPTVGVGGLISGGGLGFLWRKYGLAADNVLDALIVDVNGKLLDRKSMGEDLFWAIRGGGGASYGVIVAWKLQLVRVPPIVTVFQLTKTMEQGSVSLLHKWQETANKFPKDMHMITLNRVVAAEKGRTVATTFEAVFQGRRKDLLSLMDKRFPELRLKEEDCTEMSWVNSTIYVYYSDGPVEILLNRTLASKTFWKGGSDIVRKAISISSLKRIFEVMLEMGEEFTRGVMLMQPMGGILEEIPESSTPFPHRKGNLYMIAYNLNWVNVSDSPRYLAAARRLYEFMTPFVSKSPRSSYFNYRDLDLGANKDANTTYKEAQTWGKAYFMGNFERLALVKRKVDPENFFWSEQSIPPFAS